jgi:hypothetical protein
MLPEEKIVCRLNTSSLDMCMETINTCYSHNGRSAAALSFIIANTAARSLSLGFKICIYMAGSAFCVYVYVCMVMATHVRLIKNHLEICAQRHALICAQQRQPVARALSLCD